MLAEWVCLCLTERRMCGGGGGVGGVGGAGAGRKDGMLLRGRAAQWKEALE